MLLIAPDSYKGSLPAWEAARALADGARLSQPALEVRLLPLADGGEGTVEVIRRRCGGSALRCATVDPWGRRLTAAALRVDRELLGLPPPVGVLEWSSAAAFLPGATPRQALDADSRGVGLVMRELLRRGCRSLIVGLGGSATTDGGAGMLRALGARITRPDGRDVAPGAAGLSDVAAVDRRALPRVPLAALYDVTAPLEGRRGTVARFAAQKGADLSARLAMEEAMGRWARLLDPRLAAAGRDGAGAAGGGGFALAAALGARLVAGASAIADICDLDGSLARADAVWTGEGRVDGTSADGKVVGLVLSRARIAASRPRIWVIAGDIGPGADRLFPDRVAGLTSLVHPPSHPPPPCWHPAGSPRSTRSAMDHPRAALREIGRALAGR